MACGSKGTCKYAYRKPGKNTVHCAIQTKQGGKWEFCAHQYLCKNLNRYELSKEAEMCPLPKKIEERVIEEANEALAKAEIVFADELQPKLTVPKKKSNSAKKGGTS